MSTRTSIRNAAKTAIDTVTELESVYIGRRRSVPASDLPACFIYVESEEKTPSNHNDNSQIRTLALRREIIAQDNNLTTLETTLDRLEAATETALFASTALAALILQYTPENVEYQLDEDAAHPHAIAIATDQIIYDD